jgi:hypothetical protein
MGLILNLLLAHLNFKKGTVQIFFGPEIIKEWIFRAIIPTSFFENQSNAHDYLCLDFQLHSGLKYFHNQIVDYEF